MPENIGFKIKEIRDSYDLSQERFAKRLGLSGKTISAYETGRTQPPLKVVEKIARVYKTPIVSIDIENKEDLKERLFLIEKEFSHLRDLLRDSLSL
jgi:transcriptional regulator with XRE-family HTH domain